MQSVFREVLDSSYGPVTFEFDGDGLLLEIRLPRRGGRRPRPSGTRPAGAPSLAAVRKWLDAVTSGRDAAFPGSWQLPGTAPFSRRVYRTVQRLPAGETRSYGEIAASCGSPGAARAVGTAMANNPLPLLIPCHRVVASTGLGGFGCGVAMKREMLAREGALASSL